jgi:hypothetical protein
MMVQHLEHMVQERVFQDKDLEVVIKVTHTTQVVVEVQAPQVQMETIDPMVVPVN